MARHADADYELLRVALAGGEAEIARINAAIREIQAQLGHRVPGRPRASTDGAVAPAKRVMSAAARKRIAAAQRKRWAELKKSQAQAKAAAPKKRKLSAAARKKMGDAARKRWAAQRKATGKKTKAVATAATAAA